jgi:hypothetical protein
MHNKQMILTSCLVAGLLLAAGPARAADDGEGDGAKITPAELQDACKAQAAKLNLTGADAEDYLAKCKVPSDEAARSADPEMKLEGKL